MPPGEPTNVLGSQESFPGISLPGFPHTRRSPVVTLTSFVFFWGGVTGKYLHRMLQGKDFLNFFSS